MLGNDVVDLCDADSQPESFRPRFDARVFVAEERRAISRDRDPLARRWAHWAAKQAACKFMKQIDSKFIFSPSELSVHFDSSLSGSDGGVERQGVVRGLRAAATALSEVEVHSFETEESVHVIAIPSGADWGAVDACIAPLEAIALDPSVAVRNLAIREASRSLGIAPARLSVGRRDESGRASGWRGGAPREGFAPAGRRSIPTIELDGAETELSLTLSHHGRFIGFAMTPRVEAALLIHGRPRRDSKSSPVRAGALTL